MNILIIGAGWYGLHLASVLKDHNITYKILEINNDIFMGSSSKNQNRLHLGYHYPRSIETINECRIGYEEMLQKYPTIIEDNINNYYFIHTKSVINSLEYEKLFNLIPSETSLKMNNVISSYIVEEKIINFNEAILYFDEYKKDIDFNYDENDIDIENKTYKGIKYDYIIDCSFNMSKICREKLKKKFITEICVSLIYEKINNLDIDFSITVMDGLFYSLYPYPNSYNKKYYTLTDVEYTPLYKSHIINDIINYKIVDIDITKTKMEHKISTDYTDFTNNFKYVDYFISYKNKFDYINDDRSLYIQDDDNIIIFIGGKITGIFEMEKYIRNKLKLHL